MITRTIPILLSLSFLTNAFSLLRCNHLVMTSRFPFSSLSWWDVWSHSRTVRSLTGNLWEPKNCENYGFFLQKTCARVTKKSIGNSNVKPTKKKDCRYRKLMQELRGVLCERVNKVRVRSLQRRGKEEELWPWVPGHRRCCSIAEASVPIQTHPAF